MLKNWRGQPLHNIDGFTWFQTTDEERAKLIAKYDQLCQGDKEKEKLFDSLVSDLRAIAVCESEYNSGDC